MASHSGTEPETVQYASHLAEISARQDIPDEERWGQVATTARKLADRLRVRHGEIDEHSALGATPLPRTLTSLVNEALTLSTIPNDTVLTAVYELLRTSANLCMDHDANRKLLLDATFPQTVISLLRRYSAMEIQAGMLNTISLLELQVLKVCAGVLLNMSLHYEPIRRYLISANAPDLLIYLRSVIFPPCVWSTVESSGDKSVSDIKAEWTWRSGFSSWSSLALAELLRENDAYRILELATLRHLVGTLQRFKAPHKTVDVLTHEPTIRNTFCTIEEDLLVDTCSLLESLALDSEDVQKYIGQTVSETNAESNPGPLLKTLTEFIEAGEHPSYWSLETTSEMEKHIKSFEMCKAAVIKTIVEVAGCLPSMDVLWDLSRSSGWFVSSMIRWTKLNPQDQKNDLMLICATLSLANLARRESHCTALVQAPVSIVSDLVSLLDIPDIKVRHGALGLLKHLAQTTATQATLSEAKVIEKLIKTEVWGEKLDMAEPVQLLAIGTAKHLSTNNAGSAIVLATAKIDDNDPHSATGVEQILGLVKRSDTVAVKSEGSRALFQVVRSLCSQPPKPSASSKEREIALEAVTHPTVIRALVELANQGRFKPYFVLIIEGVLGLTLLSLQPNGAPLVAKGLLATLPSPPTGNSSQSASQQSSQTSPNSAPVNLLELLLDILTHETYADESIPVELRINTCSLLASVGRRNTGDKDMEHIRLKCYDSLKSLAADASDARLQDAAQKAVNTMG